MSFRCIPGPPFESSLSIDDIENNFKGSNVFEGIVAGLTEAIAYERGELVEGVVIRKRSLPEKNETTAVCCPNNTEGPLATDEKSAEVDWGKPCGDEVW